MNTSSGNNFINLNISNLNRARNNSYYKNKVNHSFKPKPNKLSYRMNLKNPTNFSPYEIIYFFIYYNYIIKKFNGSSEHLDYIEHNISGLSAEEKESLFLLILKKISQDNFVKFVQSGSEFKEVKISINFLIQILFNIIAKKFSFNS